MRGVMLVLLEGSLGRETLAAGADVIMSFGFLVLVQRPLCRKNLVAFVTDPPVRVDLRRMQQDRRSFGHVL